MKLPDKHHSFVSSAEVNQICKPLEQLNMNFFNRIRFYNDGSIAILTNNAKWLNHCLIHERPREGNIMGLQQGIYLWQDILETEVVRDAKNDFNICKGIQFLNIEENYRDVFAFGSTIDTDFTVSFYFNNLDLLQKFILFFNEKSEKLFSDANKSRIITPKIMKIADIKPHLSKVERINKIARKHFQAELNQTLDRPLTERQLECLSYYVRGQTSKEMAKTMSISYRTIEDHLSTIRDKLNCRTKAELKSFYHTYVIGDKTEFYWGKK